MRASEKITLILVPILPLLIKIIYLPVEIFIVVKLLGCGCVGGFDTNDFNNKIMVPIVLIVSLISLMITSRKLSGWKRPTYLAVGGLAQIFLSLCWGMFVWM